MEVEPPAKPSAPVRVGVIDRGAAAVGCEARESLTGSSGNPDRGRARPARFGGGCSASSAAYGGMVAQSIQGGVQQVEPLAGDGGPAHSVGEPVPRLDPDASRRFRAGRCMRENNVPCGDAGKGNKCREASCRCACNAIMAGVVDREDVGPCPAKVACAWWGWGAGPWRGGV